MIQKLFFDNPHGQSFHYVLYTPPEFDGSTPMPLVIFMHGWGEKGNEDGSELDRLFIHGYLKYAGERDYPFMIAAPQCPSGKIWWAFTESLNAWLDHLTACFSVDPRRVALTGLSMGGYASWLWAECFPERFRAIAPICGGGVPVGAQALCGMPVWAFHGDSDTTVPPQESLKMVSKLNSNGGNAKLTLYPGCGHNSWEQAYQDEALIEWLAEHTK